MKDMSDIHEHSINSEEILKEKPVFVVKNGSKYVAKNDPEKIRQGKPRYYISEAPYKFFRAMEASDAQRSVKGSVIEKIAL